MRILLNHKGQEIRLTEERLAHILEHPEMRGLDLLIADTLKSPEVVVKSRSDESVRLYYQYLPETVVGRKWICVAVKEDVENPFILTAYLTDKPKKGEVLWPSE